MTDARSGRGRAPFPWHDRGVPTGRFAPSPTGTFHLGNLRTAVAAHLFAVTTGDPCRLRWEDLDPTASVEHEDSQRRDFARLGLHFDGPELRQRDRVEAYDDVLLDLDRAGLTYRCWCSRKDIREASVAPHGPPGAYPGTCRRLTRAEVTEREQGGRPPAIRLRAGAPEVTIRDRVHGRHTGVVDDFVLRRGDGTPAYNLVVVVDDAFQGIEEVVRGDDLLSSSPRHAHLHHLLGTPEPAWVHVPLVTDPQGDRLAKRDGSAGLDEWLRAGGTVGTLLSDIGASLGMELAPEADLDDLRDAFDAEAVTPAVVRYDPTGPRLSSVD